MPQTLEKRSRRVRNSILTGILSVGSLFGYFGLQSAKSYEYSYAKHSAVDPNSFTIISSTLPEEQTSPEGGGVLSMRATSESGIKERKYNLKSNRDRTRLINKLEQLKEDTEIIKEYDKRKPFAQDKKSRGGVDNLIGDEIGYELWKIDKEKRAKKTKPKSTKPTTQKSGTEASGVLSMTSESGIESSSTQEQRGYDFVIEDDHYYHYWKTLERDPDIDEGRDHTGLYNEWIVYAKDCFSTAADPNDTRITGDIWVAPQKGDHVGKQIRISHGKRKAANSNIEGSLVTWVGRPSDPHDHFEPHHVYAADLSMINLDSLTHIRDNLYEPSENIEAYLITNPPYDFISDPSINCKTPVISSNIDFGTHLAWIEGEYDNNNQYTCYPDIKLHSIEEGMTYSITSTPWNKYFSTSTFSYPYLVFAEYTPNINEIYWNAKWYNVMTKEGGTLFQGEYFSRSNGVTTDPLTLEGMAAVEAGRGYGGWINFFKLSTDLDRTFVTHPDPQYEHAINLGGRIGALNITSDDKEIITIYSHYRNSDYGGFTDVEFYNNTNGLTTVVAAGPGQQCQPNASLFRDGNARFICRSDNGMVIQQTEQQSAPDSGVPMVFSGKIVDKEKPRKCNDPPHLTEYYQGDLNQDCYVNLLDYAIMHSQWLRNDCNAGNYGCNGADINKDRWVDIYDRDLLDTNIGRSTNPNDPNVITMDPPAPVQNLTIETIVENYDPWMEYEDWWWYYDDFCHFFPEECDWRWAPDYSEKMYIYKIQDNTFGRLEGSQIEIPTKGIEKAWLDFYYLWMLDMDPWYYEFQYPYKMNSWSKSEGDTTTFISTRPHDNINLGTYLLSFKTRSPHTINEAPVTIRTAAGDITTLLPVPREKTHIEDLNNDGIVNVFDTQVIRDNWLRRPDYMGKNKADLNRDGIVNLFDFNIVAGAIGERESWYVE